jgi:DNA-binding phage protein
MSGRDQSTQAKVIQQAQAEEWEMKKKAITTHLWDAAAHLETEQDMALYVEAALEEKDPVLISAVLGDIGRAKRIAQIAEENRTRTEEPE